MISDREAIRWSEAGGSRTAAGKARSIRRNLPPCRFSPIIVREPERQKGILLSEDWERGTDNGEKFDGDLPDSPDSGGLHVHPDQRDQERNDRPVEGRKQKFTPQWPPGLWEEVSRMYASGLTVSEISQRIGKKPAVICDKMRRMGYQHIVVKRRKQTGPVKWKPDKIQAIKAMAREGYAIQQIAEEFGVHYDTMRSVLRNHGIQCIKRPTGTNAWTQEDEEILEKMRAEKKTVKEISEVLGRSQGAIYAHISKKGMVYERDMDT